MSTRRKPLAILSASSGASQVVPPTGHSAWLTSFTALTMAFLAVFALALSMAANRMGERWSSELSRKATIRISAPLGQESAQINAALAVLETTPGVAGARLLDANEERALLEPWFGVDLPLDSLPIPKLIEIVQDTRGFDANGLRLRLQAEAPAAVLDDHSRWREPLVDAARSLTRLGVVSVVLIGLTLTAIVSLAASASLSANAQVIRVLRLVGAQDSYIAKAFVRRFTLRALFGALAGCGLGMLAIFLVPGVADDQGFLTGIRFQSWEWVWPLLIPPVSAVVAYWATRFAAFGTLRGMT